MGAQTIQLEHLGRVVLIFHAVGHHQLILLVISRFVLFEHTVNDSQSLPGLLEGRVLLGFEGRFALFYLSPSRLVGTAHEESGSKQKTDEMELFHIFIDFFC